MIKRRPIVLLVEPDASYRILLAHLLEDNGWRVLTASSLANAVEATKAPDAVVISIEVAAADHEEVREAARLCASLNPAKDIPVVLISELSEDEYRNDLRQLDTNYRWLRKPLEAGALNSLLIELLDNTHKASDRSVKGGATRGKR